MSSRNTILIVLHAGWSSSHLSLRKCLCVYFLTTSSLWMIDKREPHQRVQETLFEDAAETPSTLCSFLCVSGWLRHGENSWPRLVGQGGMLVEKHQNAHLVCGHLENKMEQKYQTIDDVSLMSQPTYHYKTSQNTYVIFASFGSLKVQEIRLPCIQFMLSLRHHSLASRARKIYVWENARVPSR